MPFFTPGPDRYLELEDTPATYGSPGEAAIVNPAGDGMTYGAVGVDGIAVTDGSTTVDPSTTLTLTDNFLVTDLGGDNAQAGLNPARSVTFTDPGPLSGLTVDATRTTPDSLYTRLRNTVGGVRYILGAGGTVSLQQINASGTFEQNWFQASRNDGVIIYYAGNNRIATTNIGVSITGDINGVNATINYSVQGNQFMSANWDGADTTVSLQHNGTARLTVDTNGVTIPHNISLLLGGGVNTGTLSFNSTSGRLEIDSNQDILITADDFIDVIAEDSFIRLRSQNALSGTTDSTFTMNGEQVQTLVGVNGAVGDGSWNVTVRDNTGGTLGTLTVNNAGVQIQGLSSGSLGFFGATPAARQTVTGSRADPEAALANLLTAFANYGIIVDSTTA